MLSICFWISFFPCKNKELQEKANEYFEEITQLAKSNSPAFFARFQEIYPNFVSEIMKAEPKFRVSELTLCAFIYLGFKTKEIAEYTSTSIYTVKSRKTNLRKKLNVPARENFDVWMRNLGGNKKTLPIKAGFCIIIILDYASTSASVLCNKNL